MQTHARTPADLRQAMPLLRPLCPAGADSRLGGGGAAGGRARGRGGDGRGDGGGARYRPGDGAEDGGAALLRRRGDAGAGAAEHAFGGLQPIELLAVSLEAGIGAFVPAAAGLPQPGAETDGQEPDRQSRPDGRRPLLSGGGADAL